jgi:hypothetical protein
MSCYLVTNVYELPRSVFSGSLLLLTEVFNSRQWIATRNYRPYNEILCSDTCLVVVQSRITRQGNHLTRNSLSDDIKHKTSYINRWEETANELWSVFSALPACSSLSILFLMNFYLLSFLFIKLFVRSSSNGRTYVTKTQSRLVQRSIQVWGY